MLGALKNVWRRKTHPCLHQSPRIQAEADTINCNLFSFLKWSQEVNSSCLHSWREAKQTENTGWAPWLLKGDLANLNQMLNSKLPIQFYSAPFLCPVDPPQPYCTAHPPFQLKHSRTPKKMWFLFKYLQIFECKRPKPCLILLCP